MYDSERAECHTEHTAGSQARRQVHFFEHGLSPDAGVRRWQERSESLFHWVFEGLPRDSRHPVSHPAGWLQNRADGYGLSRAVFEIGIILFLGRCGSYSPPDRTCVVHGFCHSPRKWCSKRSRKPARASKGSMEGHAEVLRAGRETRYSAAFGAAAFRRAEASLG